MIMTLGEKLALQRKNHHYTQEQLADLLGVSRQSVSKWESDISYPETDKLVRISQMYQCSLDYLLKEEIIHSDDFLSTHLNLQETTDSNSVDSNGVDSNSILSSYPRYHFKTKLQIDKKSQHTFAGIPLWHICTNPRKTAKGFFAMGFKAQGIFSLGILSLGVFSFGFLSLGLFSIAMLAVGALAIGCFSIGAVAIGTISFGIISVGAVAIGHFSIGALAIGKYFAMGDSAHAAIAIGKTTANGTLFEAIKKLSDLSSSDISQIKHVLDQTVPSYLSWANQWIQLMFKS